MATPETEPYAAIDLGSNSFHMIVANYSGGRIQVIDRIRDMIRLAGGLTADNLLSEEAMARALECLERFGQRIKEIPKKNVRAVGTNTLRQARNGALFLKQARKALGHSIEIIAGREEARLAYLGVAHAVFGEQERRVVDIGGGSTEAIIGRGFEAELMESLHMGCVNMSQRFFADGTITTKKMRKAILYARQELEAIEAIYKQAGWDAAIGSSGTILAINEVIKARGRNSAAITRPSLIKLKKLLIELGHTEKLSLEGLSPDRASVFAGGVAILCAVFDAFELKEMTSSEGALREGLLHDLIGRRHARDIREKTIHALAVRYQVDTGQAQRVADTVRYIHQQLQDKWGLEDIPDLRLLLWAAKLHELGLAVAHSQYQKHGAYLVQNSDLPGFSKQEQSNLATLIRCHRRKFPPEALPVPGEDYSERILRLCVILRLACVLNRSRSSNALPQFTLRAKDAALRLHFPEDWLDQHPLTGADLETEAGYLKATGFTLNHH